MHDLETQWRNALRAMAGGVLTLLLVTHPSALSELFRRLKPDCR
jgi:hypothetical protein